MYSCTHPTNSVSNLSLPFSPFAVFPGVPAAAGMQCQGEDRSIYRRGARRWRKLYKVNGHIFQAKRFNRVSYGCRQELSNAFEETLATTAV